MYLIWGGLMASPLAWMYYGVRIFISAMFVTLLVIWDLVTTIWSIIWNIITNLVFLLVVAGIFIIFLVIHLEWSKFVVFLNDVFMPFIQVQVNVIVLYTDRRLSSSLSTNSFARHGTKPSCPSQT